MTTLSPALRKHLDCKKDYHSSCKFHTALARMNKTSKAKNAQGYIDAYNDALDSATRPEGIFPLGANARMNNTRQRIELVNLVHANLDLRFHQDSPRMTVYVTEEESPARTQFLNFTKALDSAYAEQDAFNSILFEEAFTNPLWADEAVNLHPASQPVSADLTQFEASNAAHAHVMTSIINAVIDQKHVVKVQRGEQMDPHKQAEKATGIRAESIRSHDDEIYEATFNEGWLYSFYHAVEIAKNASLFTDYTDSSSATSQVAMKDFIVLQKAYWDAQYNRIIEDESSTGTQRAFFDGAVTAWDHWLEDV